MPRKRDHSADRVRRYAEVENDRLARALRLVNEAALLGPAYEALRHFGESDWEDSAKRAKAANCALQLDELDQPLNKAFKAFDLDPRNPFHWRKLLAYFAEAHFGSKRLKRGANKVWSDDRLCQLLSDFDQVKSRRMLVPGSTISDLEVCSWLKRHPTLCKRYQKVSANTLLRNLQRARNPNENGLLAELATTVTEPYVTELRAAAKRGDIKWDAAGERRLHSLVLPTVLKALSSRWRSSFKKQEACSPSELVRQMEDPKLRRAQRRAGLGYLMPRG